MFVLPVAVQSTAVTVYIQSSSLQAINKCWLFSDGHPTVGDLPQHIMHLSCNDLLTLAIVHVYR